MSNYHDRPVVVGVDGTEAGAAAVRLAGVEAVLRGAPVDLVAAYRPHPDEVLRAAVSAPRSSASRWLADAAAALKVVHPDLPVRTALVPGDLTDGLISRSAGAGLLVIGAGGLATAVHRVAGHSLAPVLVVPAGSRVGGPVAVGIDGVAVTEAAVDFGFAEAALRGVRLHAVHMWTGLPSTALTGVDPFAYDIAVARTEAERVVAEALAGWSSKYPDVPVDRRVMLAAHVGEELIRRVSGAGLLVLGTRSGPADSGLLLGPVTRFVLQRMPCPVAVLSPSRP